MRAVLALAAAVMAGVAGVTGGCAGGGEAFRPAFAGQEEAVIYVYRLGGLLAQDTVDIYLDQEPIARLSGGEYVAQVVPAGEHILRVEGGSSSAARVTVPAGESAFLEVRSGGIGSRPVLDVRTREYGMEMLSRTRRSTRPLPETAQ